MLNSYKISPFILFVTVAFLSLGELFSGTSLYFVAMMVATLLCIAVTYNMLGGLGTFSGIIFTAFSLRTIVISQFAKVILFEPANSNLEVPLQTIAVYMVFFFSAMLGVFIFGRIRLALPKPLETAGPFQADMLYAISLSLGMAASIVFKGTAQAESMILRGFALGFRGLIIFALVVAIDNRIKSTDGEHSFGIQAFIPWAFATLLGFTSTSRGEIITPSIVYFVTCFVRSYRLERRHYLAAALGIVGFVFIISPLEIYSRNRITSLNARDKASEAFNVLLTIPDWKTVTQESEDVSQSSLGRGVYFSRPGTFVLSRLSLIGPDSTMISACSGGYHYGWTSFKIDFLRQVPKYLYKNKPEQDAAGFTGRVTGQNPDEIEDTEGALSPIADAFGAFGWWGVVAYPFLVFPVYFIILDSMFDIRKPWGTAVLGIMIPLFAEGGMGGYVGRIIRFPIEILLLSYLLGWIVRMIPMRGDRGVRFRSESPNYEED
jgi:hypothetical protein